MSGENLRDLLEEMRKLIVDCLDFPSRVSLSLVCKLFRKEIAGIEWQLGKFDEWKFLEMCIQLAYFQMLEYAWKCGAFISLRLLVIAIESHQNQIALWLRKNIDPKYVDSQTLLMAAAGSGNEEMVQLFTLDFVVGNDYIFEAANFGHAKVALFLRAKRKDWDENLDDVLVTLLARKSDIPTMEYVLQQLNMSLDLVRQSPTEFKVHMRRKRIISVSMGPRSWAISTVSMLLEAACRAGNVSLAKWCIEKGGVVSSGCLREEAMVNTEFFDFLLSLVPDADLDMRRADWWENPNIDIISRFSSAGSLAAIVRPKFGVFWDPKSLENYQLNRKRFQCVKILVSELGFSMLPELILHIARWATFEELRWCILAVGDAGAVDFSEVLQIYLEDNWPTANLDILKFLLEKGAKIDKGQLLYLASTVLGQDALEIVRSHVRAAKFSAWTSKFLTRFAHNLVVTTNSSDRDRDHNFRFRPYGSLKIIQWLLEVGPASLSADVDLQPLMSAYAYYARVLKNKILL